MALAASAVPVAPVQQPTASGRALLPPRFLVAAAAIVAVVVIAVLTLAPATTSADGAFSVKIPSGWHQKTDFVLPGGEKPVMTLYGEVTNGVQAHIIVTNNHGDYVLLSKVDQVWPTVLASQVPGLPARFSPLTSRSVDGTDALVTEYRSSQVGFVFIIVDHNNHTYLIGFSSADSQFNRLRDGDFASLLASWKWN